MEPGPGRKPVQMHDQFDAILYLGLAGDDDHGAARAGSVR